MSVRRRLERLERAAVSDGSPARGAGDPISKEALKRVTDEDLYAMAELLEGMTDATGEEPEAAMREEHRAALRRYGEIYREVAGEMASGR
ncbi:MAG: hypothetical protein M3Q49_05905 [Actinomycetota bacterium]|nr:hypothetical protein [Actinomycetota bacterium]PLS86099.1 MAG: hypothetical protein CYG60_09045 [Actinomycetota bacterium]